LMASFNSSTSYPIQLWAFDGSSSFNKSSFTDQNPKWFPSLTKSNVKEQIWYTSWYMITLGG
jgi:hypothetical protein